MLIKHISRVNIITSASVLNSFKFIFLPIWTRWWFLMVPFRTGRISRRRESTCRMSWVQIRFLRLLDHGFHLSLSLMFIHFLFANSKWFKPRVTWAVHISSSHALLIKVLLEKPRGEFSSFECRKFSWLERFLFKFVYFFYWADSSNFYRLSNTILSSYRIHHERMSFAFFMLISHNLFRCLFDERFFYRSNNRYLSFKLNVVIYANLSTLGSLSIFYDWGENLFTSLLGFNRLAILI